VRILLPASITASAALGQAGYVWEPANLSSWTNNGNSTFFDGSGGAAIWTPAVSGANANDYEVQSVLSIQSGGGTFIHFLRAGTGVSPGQGNYISVEYAVPAGWQDGGQVTMSVNRCVDGVISQISSSAIGLRNGDTIRTIAFGTTVRVFAGGTLRADLEVTATTGHPGYGGYGMLPSNSRFTDSAIRLRRGHDFRLFHWR
jgi:hypothetical protein